MDLRPLPGRAHAPSDQARSPGLRPAVAALLVGALAWAVPSAASATCGDGLVDAGEGCDDGNTLAGDGCSATCTVETGFVCAPQTAVTVANGHLELPGVQRFNATDTYIPGWVIAPTTEVDYVSSAPWTCSGGSLGCVDLSGTPSRGILYQDLTTVAGTTYTLTFRMAANCASACTKNGYVSASDGAGAPFVTALYTATVPIYMTGRSDYTLARFTFTAVSATTRIAFTATEISTAGMFIDDVAVAGSVCRTVSCGNGTLDAGETCDDGNTRDGDGCSAVCQREAGYACPTPGAACAPTCGDGVVVGAEACDDGNLTSGDGCSSTCGVEAGYVCGVADTLDPRSVCVRPPVVVSPADGSTTTSTRPVITGTAAPGTVVTIVIDGVDAGTATADASGNWSFTPSTDLVLGAHTVTADVRSGLLSARGNTSAFTVDLAVDAGPPPTDAGTDAGDVDLGTADAGDVDLGTVDAGDVDLGSVDAGDVDLGSVDAGGHDAGGSSVDLGIDLGSPVSHSSGGCCRVGGAGGGSGALPTLGVLALLGGAVLRRRARRGAARR